MSFYFVCLGIAYSPGGVIQFALLCLWSYSRFSSWLTS